MSTHKHTHTYSTKREHSLDVSVFCSVQLQWSEYIIWGFEENEEVDEDIGMVVSGFIFLASKIHKKQEAFLGEAKTE